MNILMTCRECGHQEQSSSEHALMVRIKMFNHVQKRHHTLVTTTSRARMLMHERVTTPQEQYERDSYNLEPVY